MRHLFSSPSSALALALAFAFSVSGSAYAAPILQESFNDSSAYQGSVSVGPGPQAFSEAWVPTLYYNIKNANGWNFYNGAYYATNDSGNGAVLLNEGSNTGRASATQPLATNLLTGLTVGQEYVVNFSYWGDNNPGLQYVLAEYLNGSIVQTLSQTEGAAGSKPNGIAASFTFLATADTAVLGFGQASQTPASAIIDDISVNAVPSTSVPEPISTGLMAIGFIAFAAVGRRRA